VEWWEKAREDFPVTQKMIYMNIALGNSMPQRVMDRVFDFYRAVQRSGPVRDHWHGLVESARAKVASLMGAEPAEIVFTKNTSDGINIGINGIGLGRGDNVIINNLEHPSNREPWLNLRARGVEVRVAWSREYWLNPQDVFNLADSRTRAIGISHVEYNSGVRNDLAAYADFCRRNDIRLIVDGMQSAGVVACDLHKMNVDLFAAGGHKALFGPHGSGVLFCSQDVIERIRPIYAGMSPAVSAAWDRDAGATFSVDPRDARKFEYGNLNVAGITALDAGVEFILELGIGNIEQRVLELSGKLHDGLARVGATVTSPREDQRRAGIVIVHQPNPAGMFSFLTENGVCASLMSAGMMRFSPHFYNTVEEVDRVVELVGEFVRTIRR
jgi:selenocysteine lyase/cysteine desulfurase